MPCLCCHAAVCGYLIAAQPKERQRHNSKCKEHTKTLARLVEHYNALVESLRGLDAMSAYSSTSLDAVKSLDFKWLLERMQSQQQSGMGSSCEHRGATGVTVLVLTHWLLCCAGSLFHCIGVARSLQLCEADNKVSRLTEELQLLEGEMRACITYYERLIIKLQALERGLQAGSDLVAAGFTVLAGTGRYQPSPEQLLADPLARSGALSYVHAALAEVEEKLGVAQIGRAHV